MEMKKFTGAKEKIIQICADYFNNAVIENGFENFSYFIRKFKEYKGVTPKEYRKHQAGSGESKQEL